LAQYKIDIIKSELTINGNASTHEWSLKADSIAGSGTLAFGSMQGFTVSTFDVEISVAGLKSDKAIKLEKKAHRTLLENDFPYIKYHLIEVKDVNSNDQAITFTALGELNIAGTTKEIEMIINSKVLPNKDMLFSGKKRLTMTDFKLEPPTALFGMMKCDDDVIIQFELTVRPYE
jgi:hypothetical protein